jgi:P4 family phage/plasmid primase-like protien
MASDKMSALEKFHQHELFHFLHAHPCAKGKDATITGMGDLTGKWHIPEEDYPKLLDLLNDYLFVQGNRPLGFVEQPRLDGPKPLLIDLDFHYPKDKALVRRFTEKHIKAFCQELANAYERFFDMGQYEGTNIRFFVTLRPQPYGDKDKIKDGIHIVSPEATLSNEKWNVIRNYLLSENVIGRVFENTEYINSPEDVYDSSMGRKQGWMFYGASKPSIPAYQLTNVITYEPTTGEWSEEPKEIYSPKELLELMSVRYNVENDINEVREEMRDDFQAYLNPIAQPIIPDSKIVEAAASVIALQSPLIAAVDSLLPRKEDDTNIIQRLVLECLSVERADNRDEWIRVGWCLHNINPTDEMFDLWIDFSKKSPKFRSNDVSQLRRDWLIGMRKEGDGPRLGIRSLFKWARDDNPELCKQIIDADTCEFIIRQTDATHYHIAMLMKKMFGPVYIASIDSRNTEWYHYDEYLNMWRHLNQGMELKKKICVEVAERISEARNIVAQRKKNSTVDKEEEVYMDKMKALLKMQGQLYTSGFNESVMKMCTTLFYEEDFVNKLNVHPYLFGCVNGILELRHKGSQDSRERVIFRQGRPEDYVSFLAGRNHPETEPIVYRPYEEYLAAKDPRLQEITDFFEKLFPRQDLRKHVLKLLASCLEGANREQLFYFFIGVGSNGKSKLITLMKLVFGDYQTSLQATVFTRKRPEAGAANPDIIAIKSRRFIYSQEPDHNEPLNTSRMKQMSGEDMIEARGLYKDQDKFKVMGKIFMLCNRLPGISTMDNGTWRRIRVIPFESRFEEADHPDLIAKRPGVYARDNNLDEKLMNWREPFLSYLVHLYNTDYIPNGLQPEPPIVRQESEKYKADYDSFAKFRMERIRERRDGYTEVTGEKVNIKEIHKCYRRWADVTNTKRMEAKELEHRCEEAFGDSHGKKVYEHIRVFLEEEDVEAFDKQHAENQEEENEINQTE